jgi:hypothetical protein
MAKSASKANLAKAVHSGSPCPAITMMIKNLHPPFLALVLTACLFFSLIVVVRAEHGAENAEKTKQSEHSGAKSVVQAIELNQQQRYFGKVQLTIAAQGVRMVSQSQNFVVVAKPPTWNAVVYRDDDKTIFEEDFDKFLSTGMISSMFMSYHDNYFSTKAPAKHIKVKNMNALQMNSEKGEVFTYVPNIWKFSKKEILLIHAIYKTPTNGGIPLHFEMIAHGNEASSGRSVEGNQLIYLSTTDIKPIEIDAKFFDAPKGYKRVKFVGDVTVSNRARKEATDFNQILEH